MTTTLEARKPAAAKAKPARTGVVDCDIHPGFSTPDEIMPFLPKRWQEHVKTFGGLYRQPLADTLAHPRMNPDVARARFLAAQRRTARLRPRPSCVSSTSTPTASSGAC